MDFAVACDSPDETYPKVLSNFLRVACIGNHVLIHLEDTCDVDPVEFWP